MKVRIIDACDAYKAITELLREPLPVQKGIAFYRMGEKLKEVFDYACMEERKAIETYKGEVKDSRKLKFESPEKAQEYANKVDELYNEETEVDVEPINISTMGDDIKINLKALEKFVTF